MLEVLNLIYAHPVWTLVFLLAISFCFPLIQVKKGE
jgi:hypothetical protein